MVSFFIAALVGVGVGVLSGLLGIGGGTVMVPLFRLAFGMEPIAATATSLFTIVPTSISGMWKHAKNKTSLPRVGIVCGLTGACLSPVGVWAANVSPGWAIMGAAAVVVMYSSFTMLKKALAAPKGGAAKGSRKACEKKSTTSDTAAASLAATAPVAAGGSSAAGAQAAPLEAPAIKLTPKYVAKVALIGVVAGFMSGYVGVGGGFIMVPLFVSMLGIPMRLASGTSLTAVCILAIPGVIEQAVLGNIDYMVGVAMMVGSIPGAIVGANLVKRVPERALRFAFAVFLLLMAVLLVVNEASVI
ncbi:sulfite exporter TauE/SafE family protein [Slackia isoflavoniconvertens]|uniref:sulfite exporter TauE/SafE family protein n=1 Tax=Slackia isoflavoniconvertens TaxID=572010 RepID=UPI003AEF6D3C